jgi:hypothetical protein
MVEAAALDQEIAALEPLEDLLPMHCVWEGDVCHLDGPHSNEHMKRFQSRRACAWYIFRLRGLLFRVHFACHVDLRTCGSFYSWRLETIVPQECRRRCGMPDTRPTRNLTGGATLERGHRSCPQDSTSRAVRAPARILENASGTVFKGACRVCSSGVHTVSSTLGGGSDGSTRREP